MQLQANGAAGSLEHDATSLHRAPEAAVPGPLPLGVAVLDAAVVLFGHLFPAVAAKHRLQMLKHFQVRARLAMTRQTNRSMARVIERLAGLHLSCGNGD